MKIDKNALGKRIREIRVDKCSNTMEEFGNKVGAGKSNVSRWERGENVPNSITLKRIATLGNISVDELLYGSYENVIRELIEEADYYAHHKKFNELELDPKGLNIILNEISLFYWRYYIKVVNDSIDEKKHQEEIETLYSNVATHCSNQGISMTDYKRIFQCVHSYFKNHLFPATYSNHGFIDYTLDYLKDITNEKIINYLDLASRQNIDIDPELYDSTYQILKKSMNEINNQKKDYPK